MNLRKFKECVMTFLYPGRCIICEKALPGVKSGICGECLKKLTLIREPVCIKCGRPVKEDKTLCSDCEKYTHEFISGRFSFSYKEVSKALYRFKYMDRPEYGYAFAKVLAEEQKIWFDAIRPDAFIPVPLHKKRLIKRGYNQAYELARELSGLTGIPCYDGIAVRQKNTSPQKLNDRENRQINLKNAFIVRENVVELGTIVLVDDIFTTGSTIDSLAAEFKKAGVKKVYFLTVSAAGT